MFVREFRFRGNVAFSGAELATVIERYRHRQLTSEELEEARRAITAFYVAHGYVNSGAILPDQDIRDGVVVFEIVEGVLSDIRISDRQGLLRDRYLQGRLWPFAGPPLNMSQLKEGLLLLRQNPNVKQLNAQLRPGAKPGESYLDVDVEEQQPVRLALQADNYRPPSVGAEEFVLLGTDYNLTGNSDVLDFRYRIAANGRGGFEFSGANDLGGSYTFPLAAIGAIASDTSIQLFGSRSDATIVGEPFASLNIESDEIRYGATLRQSIYHTSNRELSLSVTFERGHADTSLLREPFDITPGSVNGKIRTSVLRFTQEWVEREQDQVLALRSTFNVGIDAFGVTDNGTDRNATFVSWLGQSQYVRRLFNTQNMILLRADGQWSADPLLATEQISVGGAHTVRGYRENQLVRDTGVIASIEGRVPVLFDKKGAGIVHLAPFGDFGGAWNVDGPSKNPETIASLGVGVLFTPNPHLDAQLYWGGRLRHVPNPHDNPQDYGIHFRVTLAAF